MAEEELDGGLLLPMTAEEELAIIQHGAAQTEVSPSPAAVFNFTPLAVAEFIGEDGFLPKEYRKGNHAAIMTTLRRALFNDELIRFAKIQSITGEELKIISEKAWSDFAILKAKFRTRTHSMHAR